MTIEPDSLSDGLNKIAQEMSEHCLYGEQSADLIKDGALACGQFYGQNVRKRKQRGLHGTASAIYVLLSSRKENFVAVANKLLVYVRGRSNFESASTTRVPTDLKDDSENTVKKTEILAALNDLCNSGDYAHVLTEELLKSQNDATGSWGYFLDSSEPSEVATAYAVLALYARVPTEQLKKARLFLWKTQSDLEPRAKASDINAIASRSLILYVLSVCARDLKDNLISNKELANAVRSLWRMSSAQYKHAFEVTVEYYRDDRNHYLRIPWQIYLAHALILVDTTYFYSQRFQALLHEFNEAALSGGYKYNQSGQYVSTRTNAILYSLLKDASSLTPHKSNFFLFRDKFGIVWSHQLFRLVVIFLLGFLGLYLSNPYKNSLDSAGPLWSNIISSVFVAFLAWLYGLGRRS